MMSVSAVGRCASIVSLAPPPVAPTRRAPPDRSLPVTGAPWELVPPPPPPPHAATAPPAASTTLPLSAPRRTCRRVKAPSSQSRLGSLTPSSPPRRSDRPRGNHLIQTRFLRD